MLCHPVHKNGQPLKDVESGRLCLCEGDLCNTNDEDGFAPSHLLSRTSSEHHPFRKPGAAVAAAPDADADVIATQGGWRREDVRVVGGAARNK